MTQKIFVASDIHDDVEALDNFVDYAQSNNSDRIVLLGDLSLRPYSLDSWVNLMSKYDEAKDDATKIESTETFVKEKRAYNNITLNDMKKILDDSGIPYNVIPGNYDSNFSNVFGNKNLHLSSTKIGDAKVSGYGGADQYPSHIHPLVQLGEIVEFDHVELYNFLNQEKPDIGFIHNPPQGYCDDLYNGDHVGTRASTQYIHENYPKLILSGHIHEAGPNGNNPNGVMGIRRIDKNIKESTYVINPGNLGRFELINSDNLETDREFPYGTFVEIDIEDDGTPKEIKQYTLQAKDRNIGKIRQISGYKL